MEIRERGINRKKGYLNVEGKNICKRGYKKIKAKRAVEE
jgi:hypothetical protein